jgi:hypothetical protein
MRLVALSGLLICSLAATLRAANNDADRFLGTTKKLIQAINSDDLPAIQASFDTGMQQFMPPDKATPFFRGIVSDAGKLKGAGAPQVTGSTAIMRVTAERGTLNFKITLDESDKISELYVTPAGASPAADSTNASPVRERSDATGKYHVSAQLLGVKDGKVQLKKSDGEVISIPLAKLSAQDQDALKKLPPQAATK